MRQYQFWTYMLTNWHKTVLYTGCTNNLPARHIEHRIEKEGSFTKRHGLYYLVWCQSTKYVLNAIHLEKEIKNWPRAKKDALIEEANPEWKFINFDVLGKWPPSEEQIEEVKARCMLEEQQQNPLSFLRQIV